MALSYGLYYGNGTNKAFPVPFEYISKAHVQVIVDNIGTNFTWLDPAQIALEVAPQVGAKVRIERNTPRITPMVDFRNGSTTNANNIDKVTKQLLFAIQEAFDRTTLGSGGGDGGEDGGTGPVEEYPPIVVGDTGPEDPAFGQVWFDTGTNTIKIWNGSVWDIYVWNVEKPESGVSVGTIIPPVGKAGDVFFNTATSQILRWENGDWVAYPWGVAGTPQVITVATAELLPGGANTGTLAYVTGEQKLYVKGVSGWSANFGTVNLGPGSITGEMIAAGTIIAGKLAADAVLAINLAANSITGDKIAAATINAIHMAAQSITADKLAAGAITADKLAANSITGDKLAVASIHADRLQVNTLILGTQNIASAAITQVSWAKANAYAIPFANAPYTSLQINFACTAGASRLMWFAGASSDEYSFGVPNPLEKQGAFGLALEIWANDTVIGKADITNPGGGTTQCLVQTVDSTSRTGIVTFKAVAYWVYPSGNKERIVLRYPCFIIQELKR